ncbi:MAG: DUF2764 family protein [Spirochaetales bacterium]|nr:DUF2764 family protein [Spirochaetales bacterium]
MTQYYYLVASLPLLFFDSQRPPALDSFLQACRENLHPRDVRVLEAVSLSALELTRPSCAALDRWRTWETGLRNELVKARAKSRGLDPEGHLREGEQIVAAAEVAREAFGQETPSAAEQVLDRARWDYLDELEAGHYFDLERLVVYYLRLQILHRRALFDVEAGRAAFEQIYRGITRPIREGVTSSSQGDVNGNSA